MFARAGLHKNGFVHCDLKPENILLTCEGGAVTDARLIDFGSARLFRRSTNPRQPMAVVCTLPYCAPEALEKGARPTPMCDAYSLGATLLFYVNQTLRYDHRAHKTSRQVAELHRAGISPPAKFPENAEVAHPMHQVIVDLLCPDPDRRLSIEQLYYTLVHPCPCNAALLIILDPRAVQPCRPAAIDDLYGMCVERDSLDAFALAVNIMDRHAEITGRPPSSLEKQSYVRLSEITLYPDIEADLTCAQSSCMADIIRALRYALFRKMSARSVYSAALSAAQVQAVRGHVRLAAEGVARRRGHRLRAAQAVNHAVGRRHSGGAGALHQHQVAVVATDPERPVRLHHCVANTFVRHNELMHA